MSDRAIANRLIADAARSALGPLGLQRKGRSRLWYADEGWWLINVEFQPGLNQGTYLNIGAQWLWHDQDHRSFDEGSRMHWRSDGSFAASPQIGERGWTQFLEYWNADYFREGLHLVADVARRRVEQLRALFPDPCAVASELTDRPTRSAKTPLWHAYHIGMAAGLCGDATKAHQALSRITAEPDDPEWVHKVHETAGHVLRAAIEPETLRRSISDIIDAARESLGLPPRPQARQI